MRLGDLDDLKAHISELILVYSGTELENAILNAIDNAPTIIWCSETSEGYPLMDLRPRVKGKWINHINDNGHNIADCSLCGKATQWHDEDEDGIPRYCWYCGADMRDNKKETTFDDYLNKQLKDPEFRKEWEKLCDEDEQKGGAE